MIRRGYEDDLPVMKAIVNNPETWPNWPVLPVKREFNKDEIGIVTPEFPSTVIMINMWMVRGGLVQENGKAFINGEEIPTMSYESVDAMFEDGWVVD
jgi:hypothetical protein